MRIFVSVMIVYFQFHRHKAVILLLVNFFLIINGAYSQLGNTKQDPTTVDSTKGLKDYYKNYFPIGVAVSSRNLIGKTSELIKREFNSLTSENAMKMEAIHPKENVYFWKDADAIVQFAIANKMKVRGHNLCWHQQTPDWMFKDANGEPVEKAVLLSRLKKHIHAVVSRYKGKIYAWDVVNEAIDDNNDKFLRESAWFKICGEDFIFKAFEYAHEADPKAQLFYNDYGIEKPGKRERTYNLLKKLLAAKIPVHGVGIQGHWSIHEDFNQDLRKAIRLFSSLGLKVQITELDISVHHHKEVSAPPNGAVAAITPEATLKQIEQYKKVFQVMRDYRNVITGLTFWNVSDRSSWLDNFPVKGRKDYPLLFDQHLQRKEAYWQVVEF